MLRMSASIGTGSAQPTKSTRPGKDSTIKSFKQAGISISTDGTEDTKLYMRGLPDITVGP